MSRPGASVHMPISHMFGYDADQTFAEKPIHCCLMLETQWPNAAMYAVVGFPTQQYAVPNYQDCPLAETLADKWESPNGRKKASMLRKEEIRQAKKRE